MSKKLKEEYLTGKFTSHVRGFGFVTVEGRDQDLYIPVGMTGNALYGDIVTVQVIPQDTRGMGFAVLNRREEARVVSILERGVKTFVGTFKIEYGSVTTVIPDNQRLPFHLLVGANALCGAREGQKVVAEITDYGDAKRNVKGKIIEVLGYPDDPGVDIVSIVRTYDLPTAFPEEVMEQVDEEIPMEVKPEIVAKAVKPEEQTSPAQRIDLRDVTMVTIDGDDTKDIDDGVSLQRKGSHWVLGVHIADVAEYVHEGTPLDTEAKNRGTSVYLVDRVIPMLPRELSNGICSLNQGVDRLAMSCLMELDERGDVMSYKVTESVVRSDARLSYNGVMKLFEDGDDGEIVNALRAQNVPDFEEHRQRLVQMLTDMRELAGVLKKRRYDRGYINFDLPETKIILDQNGNPVDIYPVEPSEATELIEDFMLMANETVARCAAENKLPFVFRVHPEPDEERMDKLTTFLASHAFHLETKNGKASPMDFQNLLTSLKDKPEESMISTMVLRTMQRASYDVEGTGHFGLALKDYCHFTSPIRRYPDTQIHRILKEWLHGQMTDEEKARYRTFLPEVCLHSSAMEQRSNEAERETDKQKKVEFMTKYIDTEQEGVISGVTKWGIYVELPSTCEGMIKISGMHDDFYEYDDTINALVGTKTGKVWTLGMKMTVRVAATDKMMRTIDFVPILDESDRTKPLEQLLEAGGSRDSRGGGRSGHRSSDDRNGRGGRRSNVTGVFGRTGGSGRNNGSGRGRYGRR